MWSIKQAPDGGLNIIVNDTTATQVAQRLMCWSQHDQRITYVFGAPFQYFHIPRAVCEEGTYGDLVLMPGGDPISCNTSAVPSFPMPGLEHVAGVDPNSCVDDVLAPSGLAVEGEVGDTGFTVVWNYPENSPSPESPVHPGHFKVFYREQPDPGADVTPWQSLAPFGLPGYTRRARLVGLTPGTAYEVAVAAVDKRVWVGITSALSTPLVVTTTGTAPDPSTTSADLCSTGPGPVEPMEITETIDGLNVSLLVDNKGEGEVTIDWGDETPTGTNPGDGTTATTHDYATDGTYTITVTDADNPDRTGTVEVTVAAPGAMAAATTAPTPKRTTKSATPRSSGGEQAQR